MDRAARPEEINQIRQLIHGAIAVMIAVLAAGWYEHNLGDGEILTLFLGVMGCGYAALNLADAPESHDPALLPEQSRQ